MSSKNGKIIMLQSNGDVIKNQLILKLTGILFLCPKDIPLNIKPKGYDQQHLYVIDDSTINVGDWFICFVDGNIIKGIHKCVKHQTYPANYLDDCKKIIASTDKSLGLRNLSFDFLITYITYYNCKQQIIDIIIEESNDADTINIRTLKDNFSRKEVIELLNNFGEHVSEKCIGRKLSMIGELDKWSKNNLN